MAAYTKKTYPVGPATDGTNDANTQGSIAARIVAAILDADHKLPARNRDQDATGGADVQISAILDALDAFKADKEDIAFGTTELTGATGTYTVTAYDGIIHVNRSVPVTVSLLTAVGAAGKVHILYNRMAANTVTVDPNGAQTIGGAATLVIPAGGAAIFFSDDANWQVLSQYPAGAIDAADITTGILASARLSTAVKTKSILLPMATFLSGTSYNAKSYYGSTVFVGTGAVYGYWSFRLPSDFGTLTAFKLIGVTNSTGNAYLQVDTNFAAAGETYNSASNTIAITTYALTLDQTAEFNFSAALTGVNAGDTVGVRIYRNGGHASDTAGALYAFCLRLEYMPLTT